MLDISYVYMDVYLPTQEAGKVKIGADARIVLDAYPNIAIPAKVSFIATQAQFTPKAVETKSERDKLMFRIRVRIDPERLRARADRVRSGLPGVAYCDSTRRSPGRLSCKEMRRNDRARAVSRAYRGYLSFAPLAPATAALVPQNELCLRAHAQRGHTATGAKTGQDTVAKKRNSDVRLVESGCVYRKPKPEHSGDEARQGSLVTRCSRSAERDEMPAHLCSMTNAF